MMMNKTKSPSRKLAKYIAVLPLFVLLVTANSAYAQKNEPAKTTTSPQDTTKNIRQNDETFVVVEKQPEFPGGQEALFKYLTSNIKYPFEALNAKKEGIVVCRFVIQKDGSISDVEVIRSIDPLLDKEAIRVIEAMPKWTPAIKNGNPVNVRYTIPISFKLSMPEKSPTNNNAAQKNR